ncbi:hypothetical protein VTK56DRAFT_5088 [Thermocarpiscus australiensis]
MLYTVGLASEPVYALTLVCTAFACRCFFRVPAVLSRRHHSSTTPTTETACSKKAFAYSLTLWAKPYRRRLLPRSLDDTTTANSVPPPPPTIARSQTSRNSLGSSVITPSTPFRTLHSIHCSSSTVHTNRLRPASRAARRKRAPAGPTRLGWNRSKTCTSRWASDRKRRAGSGEKPTKASGKSGRCRRQRCR